MSRLSSIVLGFGFLVIAIGAVAETRSVPDSNGTKVRTYLAQGVVRELDADGKTVVIAHEAIPHYMEAMTMPFKVRAPEELSGLRSGDKVRFSLKVTDTESWIELISKTGDAAAENNKSSASAPAVASQKPKSRHPLLDYPFTNELGQAVRLSDFRGQALAITFFFTRCPIPDYCPRLSRNFEEASQKLNALADAPTNWHFLSVSFDTDSDTPAVLKAYGERYHYDPKHWSFLTGPREQISELASLSDVKFELQNGFINHNFRTLIIDAIGRLQMVFPMGGNLSEDIVKEIVRAAAPSRPVVPSQSETQSQRAAAGQRSDGVME
jgi:protein SCO1